MFPMFCFDICIDSMMHKKKLFIIKEDVISTENYVSATLPETGALRDTERVCENPLLV